MVPTPPAQPPPPTHQPHHAHAPHTTTTIPPPPTHTATFPLLLCRVVGWYHSHPTFPTQPSLIDIYNQAVQQHAHREESTGEEPYVAGELLVGILPFVGGC